MKHKSILLTGWGYVAFEFDAASNNFRPADLTDNPLQAHDAKCGVRVPHDSREPGLHFHAIPAEVSSEMAKPHEAIHEHLELPTQKNTD